MQMIAIDCALLLQDEITDFCIELNEQAQREGRRYRPLGRKEYLPHVSLAIGCAEEKDISRLAAILERVAASSAPLVLELSGISYVARPDGMRSWISVHSPALHQLHEQVMREAAPLLSRGATAQMFFGREGLSETSRSVVDTYPENHAFENYSGHITLGCYDARTDSLPMQTIPSALAVCHLGDGCTCMRILAKVPWER